MRDIALADLLKAGVHFGHQVSRWHPKMQGFIFTSRNGVYIHNLEKTAEQLEKSRTFLRDCTAKGGTVLFVGTKRQAKAIVQSVAVRIGAPYVVERWLGGTFTNFPTISKMMQRLTQLKEERAQGKLEKYTKKEQLTFNDEIIRLEKLVGGIERMQRPPDAVVIVDVKEEKTALHEAQKLKVPIVAIVDTNVSPEGIAYPVPGNDDATKSIQLILDILAEAVDEGKRAWETERAAAVPETPVAPTSPPGPVTAEGAVAPAVPVPAPGKDA